MWQADGDAYQKVDYRENLEKELAEINASELWQAGKVVRQLRAK